MDRQPMERKLSPDEIQALDRFEAEFRAAIREPLRALVRELESLGAREPRVVR